MNIVKIIKTAGLNIGASLLLLILSLQSFAQDKKVDVSINTNSGSGNGGWYMQPWVWIVGGLVFILLLVAIIRGGGNKN